MSEERSSQASAELKMCCADLYASDLAQWLLGDSFHPGGLALTTRLGELLEIGPDDQVLDVASGRGVSAIALAEQFGCQVTGVDYGDANVNLARVAALRSPLADRISFMTGDAEQLPSEDDSFDALICECSFCTFPDKPGAAAEFFRVLRPGGRIGLSDLTRTGALPSDLDNVLGQIFCVADARPVDQYQEYLRHAGFSAHEIERHDDALSDLVADIRTKLLGARVFAHTQRLELPGFDLDEAQATVRSAAESVANGALGYVIITARKPV